MPPNVPIPFRDYVSSLRLDWAQSPKSQWFLRASSDSYLTHNALVQQATLPSTGLTTHNNYWNTAISNTYIFGPTWLGTLVLDASLLHLTQTRNSDLGFALQFPFSVTALTVSGFETYGDNQFATPITLFPDLRNQEKYQVRYDVSHVVKDHAFRFGVDFIHEPVLGGAFASNQETLYTFPQNPTYYIANPAQFPIDYAAGAATTPAGDGTFSQNVQRLAFYGEDSWRATQHLTINYGLRYQTTFGLFTGRGPNSAAKPCLSDSASIGYTHCAQRAPRLPQADRPPSGLRLFARQQREDSVSRGLRHVLRRSGAEWLGHRVSEHQ